MPSFRLRELADAFGLELRGNDDHRVDSLATLANAGSGQISFLANPAYRKQLASTAAGAVILAADDAESFAGNCLVSANPYADWARVAARLAPAPDNPAGIDASAVVDASAVIDPAASVGPQAVIGPRCRIAAGVRVGPGCVVDADVEIGTDSRLVARAYLGPGTRLGERVIIHPGAIIGSDGFGLAMDQGRWLKVPQAGRVIIGDDCEVGANSTIDRGAVDDTVLDADVRLDNQVQIAHNVRIGAHTAIAGCVGIAGSTHIGRYCMIAGACGIGGHLRICDGVIVTAMSTVLDSIDEPGQYGSGIPARPHGQWKRILVRLGQLDDWARQLRQLKKNSPSKRSG